MGTDPSKQLERVPPGTPAEAKDNQIQNKHRKTDTSDTHRSKVTRSTSTDAAQDLTRHRRRAPAGSGGGSKSLSVQLQVSKEDVGTRLWSLAAWLFFFFFKLSFINNI